ncbi:MAG: RNA polymerase sigma factor, partial [Chloroflexota bacterium]
MWMMSRAIIASGNQSGGSSGRRRDTFVEMYDKHMPDIYRYISYRVGNASLAEDLTAEVFEKALRSFDRYTPEKAAPRTWLTAIARNAVIDHFRKMGKIEVVREEDAPEEVSEDPSVEDQIDRLAEVRHLRLCLADLPQVDQDIISLKFGADMNNREIARVLNISESNVGTRLYRAVK